MSENVNKPTERAIKMSDKPIKVKCTSNLWSCITHGENYLARRYADYYKVVCDDFVVRNYSRKYFTIVEDNIVNEVNVEKEQYIEMSTSLVYEVAYKGDTLAILKGVQDGREITVNVEYLPSTNFVQLTKEMQKQQKKNEDLGVLANVTDEIRKLLDDNYVICHVSANRDTKGLVEFNIMVGESV